MRFVTLAAILLAAGPAAAQQPPEPFELPVDCDMAGICSILLYPDQDPAEGVADHACGHLSYDGHNGTDFRVRNLADMDRGVTVVAAAQGIVLEVRDGMDDVDVRQSGTAALEGRFKGNYVAIRHEGGWVTVYSHLRKGSIQVQAGDPVQTGTPLGLIGLSGRTTFPHLEFVVRHEGRPVDPFTGFVSELSCTGPRQPLWSDAALAAMPYRPAWVLSAGFADEAAKIEKIRRGDYGLSALSDDAPALTFWVQFANVFGGDRYELTVTGPDGDVLVRSVRRIDDPKITYYAFSGIRRPVGGWPEGAYQGRFSLFRGGQEILSANQDIAIE